MWTQNMSGRLCHVLGRQVAETWQETLICLDMSVSPPIPGFYHWNLYLVCDCATELPQDALSFLTVWGIVTVLIWVSLRQWREAFGPSLFPSLIDPMCLITEGLLCPQPSTQSTEGWLLCVIAQGPHPSRFSLGRTSQIASWQCNPGTRSW